MYFLTYSHTLVPVVHLNSFLTASTIHACMHTLFYNTTENLETTNERNHNDICLLWNKDSHWDLALVIAIVLCWFFCLFCF